MDVARVEGAAVIRVEAGGAGDVAGLRPSDLIVGAAGTDVRTAADLARVVSSTEPGAELSLDVRADDGAERMTTARVALVPDTIPFGDDRLLYNKILLDLQAAAPGADSTLIGSATQLNLAIVHMQLGRWDLAIRALESVVLPGGPGVSATAVEYLMGRCLTEIGQFDEARVRLRLAVDAGEGTLSIGGPRVGPLARRALDRLP